MAKLSELFGRKGGEVGADSRVAHLDPPPPPNIAPPESVADANARMGEENEGLRSLMADTRRKIGELDQIKDTFDKISAPFNNALRALEQEKSQRMALTHALQESRASYETLRTEFYQVERKATTLEAEAEKLRIDLEVARESNLAFESAHLELSNEISVYRRQITEFDHQLAYETSQHGALSESRRKLQEQLDVVEKRDMELESEIASSQEKLALLEDEKRSLQIALDQAFSETASLTRRLAESENALNATREQLGKVEASFAEAFAERDKFAAALDETREQRQAEQNSLNIRLDALQSRASTAERLLAEVRQNLIVRTEESRGADRKAVEATIAFNNVEKRLAQVEAMHEARERYVKDIEQARAALSERNNAITRTLKMREDALNRAEEKIASLIERNGHLEAEAQVNRTNIEKRVEELKSALHRERMERAMVDGALEAARKDNARLQDEGAGLRSNVRRVKQSDEPLVAPDEPANDQARGTGTKSTNVGAA